MCTDFQIFTIKESILCKAFRLYAKKITKDIVRGLIKSHDYSFQSILHNSKINLILKICFFNFHFTNIRLNLNNHASRFLFLF